MCKYTNYQRTCDILFTSFAITWIVTRLGVYPTWILYSTTIEAPQIVEMFPAYYIFNALLAILLMLHVIWTYFILKIVYKAMYTGKVILESFFSLKSIEYAKSKCFYHLYAMYVYILVKDHLYLSSSYSMVNKRWRWQFFRHIDVPLTHTLYTIFKLYLFGWTNIHQCRRRTTVVHVSKLNCDLSFFFKLNFMKVYQSLRQYF